MTQNRCERLHYVFANVTEKKMLQLKIKIKSFLLATRRQNARNCFNTLLGANFFIVRGPSRNLRVRFGTILCVTISQSSVLRRIILTFQNVVYLCYTSSKNDLLFGA